ncbi:MAG: thiamine pyrophosphate-binding protein, partial [Dehalococcoidia bacterium]|nr:thiamine pyrophosphate-binding protein [Dehalococcoidia bacterium]
MTDRMKYGSDLVVELMKALGIEYVAFNPGSSFRGIHDSLVNYGENNPGILLCAHEEISVSIAQGYAVAAGKPMSAITHDLVGLQHASMAIYNAWCDQAPVLVLGGGGPMDISRRRPWIEWIHTAQVQGNLVRDFVKWDDQPCGDLSVVDSFIRGYRLATSKPCGPVYICLDALWQETELASPVDISYASKLLKSTPLAPDPDAIRKVAGWLAQAENPVIVADRYGPDSKAVDALVELAELTATPVIDLGKRFNFPNTHPMDLTGAKDILIPKADLIIFLDLEDPWGYLHRVNDPKEGKVTPLISPEVKVVDISLR